MNLKKVKREDRIKYLKEHKVIADPIEIYACADGEHFVVKQDKRKIILKLEEYAQFLKHVNLAIYNFLDIKENGIDRQHN